MNIRMTIAKNAMVPIKVEIEVEDISKEDVEEVTSAASIATSTLIDALELKWPKV